MGERSQIYVRVNKKLVVANYYHWNYGEEMISRARYGIKFINDTWLEDEDFDTVYPFNEKSYHEDLRRYFDVNFDTKNIRLSSNLMDDLKDKFTKDSFNDYMFKLLSNDDGKLFIDVLLENKTIKYAFLNCECDTNNIMNARQYMDWNYDYEDWRNSEFIDKEQKTLCEENLLAIDDMAQLMTKEEMDEFLSYNYIA